MDRGLAAGLFVLRKPVRYGARQRPGDPANSPTSESITQSIKETPD
jgi:hypothetical protein